MSIKYIYDSTGKKTGVIIPIELWNKNKSKILENNDITEEFFKSDDSRHEPENKKIFKPSKYRGIYQNIKINLEKEAKDLRDEWVRT